MDLLHDNTPEDQKPENCEQVKLFVELYAQHCSRIQYYLMALVPTSHDAVDVLQETSLVLWEKFDTFEPGTNFMAWACRIARIQALKHYEKNKKSADLFESNVLEKLALDAEQAASRPAVPLEILDFCMRRLSDIDRTLIRRRYESGSSVKRIADDIGRTANSVSKSLGRIRRSLLVCMEKQLSEQR